MTRDQAKALVEVELKRLADTSGTPASVILDDATIEQDFGWVFFYQSRQFLQTREPTAKLAGNAPYIVDRHTGALHVTGTARPLEYYISQYANRAVPRA